MRVVILGSAGIIGQHLRLAVPPDVEPVWVRQRKDYAHFGLDLTRGVDANAIARTKERIALLLRSAAAEAEIAPMREHLAAIEQDPRDLFLKAFAPDVIINLAGENRPDVVEHTPWRYLGINVDAPAWLAWWCGQNNCHYVHVSSQAVFGGEPPKELSQEPRARPPYAADSLRIPANAYGFQKLRAESEVMTACKCWSIVRPTFVLGVRPFPLIGRQNPVERWLEATAPVAESQTEAKLLEVNDRYFSPSFAWQVASELWTIAQGKPLMKPVNIGIPVRTTRYEIAQQLRTDIEIEPVAHAERFRNLAPRPMDTTYAVQSGEDGAKIGKLFDCLHACELDFRSRQAIGKDQRSKEFALFTGMDEAVADQRLAAGFGPLHNAVADDFRKANPQTDEELLNWYRTTDAYNWELSAYHIDPGFNYSGMCEGIITRLKHGGVKEALCLGDGIGDMTIALGRAGIHGVYHDLKGSRTAAFAEFRQMMYLGNCDLACTDGWEPLLPVSSGSLQAIISADFLEHVTDVEAWVRAIWDRLEPGALFFAQNAFNCGSGADGAIPQHLSRNDHWEKDWDPLLLSIGFIQLASNWYQRPKE